MSQIGFNDEGMDWADKEDLVSEFRRGLTRIVEGSSEKSFGFASLCILKGIPTGAFQEAMDRDPAFARTVSGLRKDEIEYIREETHRRLLAEGAPKDFIAFQKATNPEFQADKKAEAIGVRNLIQLMSQQAVEVEFEQLDRVDGLVKDAKKLLNDGTDRIWKKEADA